MLDFYGTASLELDHRRDMQCFKTSFTRIRSDLKSWWLNIAPDLKLESDRLVNYSQPPHIVSLNLLYHTALILLHRPFILSGADFGSHAVRRSYQVCLEATGNIYNLLTLLKDTFGFQHVSYINSYSAYIASAIAVLHHEREQDVFNTEQAQDLQSQITGSPVHRNASQSPGGYTSSGSQENLSGERLGLRFFLEVMQRTARTMPAMRRSVEIVKNHMHSILEIQTKRRLASLFHASSNLDDHELLHLDFIDSNSSGNEHCGPWMTSQAPNNVGPTPASLSPSNSQQTRSSTTSNGKDHYPRPVLPPMLFKRESIEDDVLYSGTFYPYAGCGLQSLISDLRDDQPWIGSAQALMYVWHGVIVG